MTYGESGTTQIWSSKRKLGNQASQIILDKLREVMTLFVGVFKLVQYKVSELCESFTDE